MKKANVHTNIILSLLLSFSSIAYSQNGELVSDSNSFVDLKVDLIINPIPENALIHTADSIIYIRLYENAVISQDAFRRKSLVFDGSKTFITATFDSISEGRYSIFITFPKYDIKYSDEISDIKADTTLTVTLKPQDIYDVEISADPREYSLYFGYLKSINQKEPSKYRLLGKPEDFGMPPGSFKFTILGRKVWKIKFRLDDENESEFTVLDKDFWDPAFQIENPFVTEHESPFDWIKVEQFR